MNELDVRGLSCPEPLMAVSSALREGRFPIRVMADGVAVDNIHKLLKSKKRDFTIDQKDAYAVFEILS